MEERPLPVYGHDPLQEIGTGSPSFLFPGSKKKKKKKVVHGVLFLFCYSYVLGRVEVYAPFFFFLYIDAMPCCSMSAATIFTLAFSTYVLRFQSTQVTV